MAWVAWAGSPCAQRWAAFSGPRTIRARPTGSTWCINEIKGDAAVAAHLVEFDSIHGRWHVAFEGDSDKGFSVGGKYLSFTSGATTGDVPWGDLGCDIVLECTGKFLKPEQLNSYFQRGVKRVIVAAPVKDERALNVVVGFNDRL